MKSRVRLAIVVLLGCASMARAEFREWIAADGRKLLAEFVSLEGEQVTIERRSDGRQFTLSLEKLSKEDQQWVAENAERLDVPSVGFRSATRRQKDPFSVLATGKWERHESDGLEYRFFADPKLAKASGDTQYPLVIVLHGKNGDVMSPENPGMANQFAQAKRYEKRPCFILAPQAPKNNETWSGKNGAAVIDIAEDLIKHLAVDEKRVYLTGYSMGAYGTFHLLAMEPKLFAAAVPVAGGGNPSGVRAHRKVPVWVFHGAKDDVVEVDQSRRMVEAMKKARAEVKYDEFLEGDHGIGGRVYGNEDVHEWIFQQARK